MRRRRDVERVSTHDNPRMRPVAAVAWPSFLAAALLELLVFSFFDPTTLQTWAGDLMTLSATAIYSIAFFAFWATTAAACALALVLRG